MAINRTRLITSSFIINPDQKIRTRKEIEYGEDNSTFSKDNDDNIDIDSKLIQKPESSADNLYVAFSKASSSVEINHQQNSENSTQSLLINENQQTSDEELETNVSNADDPSTLVLTFRSWFLGLLFTCLLSFINQFFFYRTSPLFVGTLVAQLLTYPLGKGMAKILPNRKFKIFRWNFTLNPGPFTIKEHCIITAMANATCVSFFMFK